MEPRPSAGSAAPEPETPEQGLDALRDHPDWDERRRTEVIDRLIARFEPGRLRQALRGRARDLHGGHGEAVLRLIEALGTPELFEELADGLAAQPDLPPERAWEALAVLQGSGLLERRPELAERCEELADLLEEGAESLDELAEQLEDDPDGISLALRGLATIEPEVRADILTGLAEQGARPGLVEFLRLLTFAHDARTRVAAIEALEHLDRADPLVAAARERIAAEHPDPAIAARAGRGLVPAEPSRGRPPARVDEPHLIGCLVTSLDAGGRGTIALLAEDRGLHVAAAFQCDVLRGVLDVAGLIGEEPGPVRALLAEIAARPDRDAIEDVPELALGLLAGSLLLCGPGTTPALRFWLERTVGPHFRPQPFAAPEPDRDPESFTADELAAHARAVLDACAGWVDDSDLTYNLAEEYLLRPGGVPPDPVRDSGAFRFLFEHRLRDRLELERRMLFWMAVFWRASGAADLALSALVLVGQLSDAQHTVPGHPYLAALAARSLATAQENLCRGIDLRDPATRRRRGRIDWP